MDDLRLNLTALRRKRLFESHPEVVRMDDLTDASDNGFAFSRRQVLKSAGLAAVALAPGLQTAKAKMTPQVKGPFKMEQDGDAVNFYLGKDLCWSIDPKQFSGSPKVVVDRTPENLRIVLKNAYYPGTSIPADFSLNLKPRLVDCLMHLKMKFGGFSTKGVFEEWLAGDSAMQSPVTLAHTEHLNAEEARLQLNGSARAEFTPDWKIVLRGENIARYISTKAELGASEVSLQIPPTTIQSSVSTTPGKRTLISFDRGSAEWQVEHGLNPERDWQLDLNSDTFDKFTLEAIETETGGSIHGVVLEQKDLSAKSTFSPLGALGHDGNAFKLPLTGVRFATLMTGVNTEHALHARYDETGKWLYGKGASFLIGAAPRDGSSTQQETENFRAFELYARNGMLEHLHCEPDILKAMVPMPGAFVEPSDVPRGTRLAFTRTPVESHPYLAQFPLGDKGDDENEFRFPANFVIGAVRALDLLVLKFEFLNMEFHSTSKGLELVKTKPKYPTGPQLPYLVVHFPAQNIAEQAYYETSAQTYPPWPKPPAPPPQILPYPPPTDSGESIPVNPSVAGSRLSGGSRLVFWVPDAVPTLPYSLTGLLDWSQLVPSLVPVALPPPPPPYAVYLHSPSPYGGMKTLLGNGGGSKVSLLQGAGKSLAAASPILSDIKYAPKYTVTIDQGKKQAAISNIQQYTKTPMDSEQLSAIGDLIAQTSPSLIGFKSGISFLPDLTIRQPHLWETAIESPYRLFLSPNQFAGWAHSKTPVGADDPKLGKKINWVELWHTRMGVMSTDPISKNPIVDENDEYYRTFRAIWSPDYYAKDSNTDLRPVHYKAGDTSTAASPFRMSLDPRDRHEIVELTSGFTVFKGDKKTSERFIRADRFMMSSLGSWMNTRGAWDLPNDPEKPVSLEEWRHRATMGRDHYVKVVYAGYLFPFGNAASLIKITERKFEQATGTKYMTAVLKQRFFIVVRQPTKVYPVAGGFQPNSGNQLPFKSITIKTLVTPSIDDPTTGDSKIGTYGQTAFWPHVAGNDFLFHISGEDWEGRSIEFSAPMAFIDRTRAWYQPAINDTMNGYNTGTTFAFRREIPMKGQKIAYAPNKKAGDTTFETSILHLGGEEPTTFPTTDPQIVSYMKADQPPFFPILQMSEVTIESIKHIASMTGSIPVAYHPQYVSNGFGDAKNAVDAFLNIVKVDGTGKIVSDAVGLAFGGSDPAKATTDKIGGLISPSMGISALSRLSGPISGSPDGGTIPGTGKSLEKLMNGGFDPMEFFGNALGDVKLLGGISLMDILKVLEGADSAFNGGGAGQALDSVKQQLSDTLKDVTGAITPDSSTFAKLLDVICPIPAFVTQMIHDVEDAAQQAQDAANGIGDAMKIPKQIQIVFRWDPQVDTHGPFVAKTSPDTKFHFTALILVPINLPSAGDLESAAKNVAEGKPSGLSAPGLGTPTYSISAALTNFDIELFDIIKLSFNSVSFKKESGKNADVNADIADITFEGALSFINGLEKVIPSDGFGDSGLSIKITPLGVKVGFSLAIPDLEVGCFALTNLSLGAELALPFTGDPLRFRFNFCSPDNPFALTIYCLGGGGSFGISLGLDGVEEIDASFEFGAEISLDFGVASGGVHIMAGFKFMLTKVATGDDIKLTGYLRIGGSLSVMAIISVSIELDMSLTYENNAGTKRVYGDATLSFSVSLLFFSISFSTSVHKEFADPVLGFKDYLEHGEQDWELARLAYAWA
jgi:hypothetical protein